MSSNASAPDKELNEIARNDFGMDYDQLDTEQKRHCAGKKGMAHRRQHEAAAHQQQQQQPAQQQQEQQETAHNTRGTTKHHGGTTGAGDPELEAISKAEFNKPYSELSTEEKRHCAGKKGAAHHWGPHSGSA